MQRIIKKNKGLLIVIVLIIIINIVYFWWIKEYLLKQLENNYQNLSCLEQKGAICSLSQNCIGKLIISSDSDKCCIGVCKNNNKKEINTKSDIKSKTEINKVRKIKNIEYAKIDKISLLLDLYLPNNSEENVSLVMFIHGGGFSSGDKYTTVFEDFFLKLVENNYAVASVNYRLTKDGYYFPEPLYDVKAAVRFIKAESDKYGIDKDNIGVMGSSAGSYFALMLGFTGDNLNFDGNIGNNLNYSTKVNVVIDLFGPTDFNTIYNDRKNIGVEQIAAETIFLKCEDYNNNPTLCLNSYNASPINYVSEDSPPILILHGGNDKLIPPIQSKKLNNKLKKYGVESEIIISDGLNHDFKTVSDKNFEKILDFLKNNL